MPRRGSERGREAGPGYRAGGRSWGVKPKSRQALADEVEREWYSSPRPSAYVSPSERERLAATIKDLIAS